MLYLTVGLVVLVLILSLVCRRLWLDTQNTGMRDFAFSTQRELEHASQKLRDQDIVLSQVGELFDHAGVALEKVNTVAAEDLKLLGHILRSRTLHSGSVFDLEWAQNELTLLGDRYGIEPESGGPFTIRNLIRIAEEVFEHQLTPNAVVQ